MTDADKQALLTWCRRKIAERNPAAPIETIAGILAQIAIDYPPIDFTEKVYQCAKHMEKTARDLKIPVV